jgi:mono/diheme cytochrome c family protein
VNLQRLLIERIEHRIIVGTISFLAILLLMGWIAINEPGRMAAFDRQFQARAIERGAALFTANCSSCHGTDGLGLVGVGPALNTPLLFGYDYLAPIRQERAALEAELNEDITDARAAEIQARLAELDADEAALLQQMQPAIDLGYDPERPDRLENLGWVGTLHNFIYTTLVHGRPTSIDYWPQAMVAWSQTAGGPLRSDQLEDLTLYIMNWDKGSNWTLEDLLAVRQHPRIPIDSASVVLADVEVVGSRTPLDEIMVNLEEFVGDPQAGEALYNGAQFACAGCHMVAAVAPLTEGTWTRTLEVRLAEPQLAGYTGEMYLVESIIHPNDYIVPGYPAGVMPLNYGDRLTYQQLADLVAYLKTQDQP